MYNIAELYVKYEIFFGLKRHIEVTLLILTSYNLYDLLYNYIFWERESQRNKKLYEIRNKIFHRKKSYINRRIKSEKTVVK